MRRMDVPKAGFRQRVFAWALARFNTRYERFVSEHKRRVFADVAGIVLKIGPGTGVNPRYLMPDRVRWTGVEPNPFMEPYLRQEASRVGMPIEIRIGTADALPVADNSVDAAISTLVLCCVPCPQRCLQEVLRVLKHLHRARSCAEGELVAVHSRPGDAAVEATGGWVPP